MLTGGASRRMGVDKAFVEVDGVPMVRRVADALSAAGAASVTAVGGDRDRLAGLGLAWCPDRWPAGGPLGGLATALGHAPPGTVLVAGCDQPWLDPATLRLLAGASHADGPAPRPLLGTDGGACAVQRPEKRRGTIAVFHVGGRLQPLPGCFPTTMAQPLADEFEAGARRLDVALAVAAGVVVIDLADPQSIRDVDRPQDLAAGTLRVHHGGRHGSP